MTTPKRGRPRKYQPGEKPPPRPNKQLYGSASQIAKLNGALPIVGEYLTRLYGHETLSQTELILACVLMVSRAVERSEIGSPMLPMPHFGEIS